MSGERLVAGMLIEGEGETDLSLRPRLLTEYIGQEQLKRNLIITLAAAKARGEALEHVLVHGPPGLGKTTLASIIAAEMGVQIRITSGPVLERSGDLAAILTNLGHGDVLFIDEIHRLPRTVEEVLYPAMEDYSLDIILGKGPGARSLRLELPRFTLVGATTRAGLLTSPLRDRFGVTYRLEFYQVEELVRILLRASRALRVELDLAGAEEIGARSRGTPRIALRLLRRVRDYAQVEADGVITRPVACAALELLAIDQQGLDHTDRQLLLVLIQQFNGGPVGIETLATALNEEPATIEDVYEPFLLQNGFLARTPRGRVAGSRAYQHLNLIPAGQLTLGDIRDD